MADKEIIIDVSNICLLKDKMEGAKKDIEKAIKSIRGVRWQEDIEKDTRYLVKDLYKKYQDINNELNYLDTMDIRSTKFQELFNDLYYKYIA